MTAKHYNLYYIFLLEKENCVPDTEGKNKVLKKVLDFFEKTKTKSNPTDSYNQNPLENIKKEE